jgi:CheY-like chemotaxis protein
MNPIPDIPGAPARVLIVDDERCNRQILEAMLAPEGFLLEAAASGEEALAMVAEHPPDLVLLDIMMPGMDVSGGEQDQESAARNISHHHDHGPGRSQHRMLGLNAGAEDFLIKPVDRTRRQCG